MCASAALKLNLHRTRNSIYSNDPNQSSIFFVLRCVRCISIYVAFKSADTLDEVNQFHWITRQLRRRRLGIIISPMFGKNEILLNEHFGMETCWSGLAFPFPSLCHCEPPPSFVRIAFNLWHCVSCESLLWPQCAHFKHENVRPFSPICFDDATTADTIVATHSPFNVDYFLQNIYMRWQCCAMLMHSTETTSTLTLETFKTHFKMIFCNELRTRRWVVCVSCATVDVLDARHTRPKLLTNE